MQEILGESLKCAVYIFEPTTVFVKDGIRQEQICQRFIKDRTKWEISHIFTENKDKSTKQNFKELTKICERNEISVILVEDFMYFTQPILYIEKCKRKNIAILSPEHNPSRTIDDFIITVRSGVRECAEAHLKELYEITLITDNECTFHHVDSEHVTSLQTLMRDNPESESVYIRKYLSRS